MKETASGGRHRTKEGIATATQAKDFATDAILLVRKFKRDERGGQALGRGGGGEMEAYRSEEQVNITGTERLRRRGRAGVFAGTE